MTQQYYPVQNSPEASYTMLYDGVNYYARNELGSPPFIEFTSNTSLHNVFNSATLKLCPNISTSTTWSGGTINYQSPASSYGASGGLIVLQAPKNKIMQTSQPLQMRNQITLRGPGRGCIIQPKTPANWNATLTSPEAGAVINGRLMNRIKVEGVTIDCNGGGVTSGVTGIFWEKGYSGNPNDTKTPPNDQPPSWWFPNGGDTGGNSAHSYFLFNEVRGFSVCGIQIGTTQSDPTTAGWIEGNQIMDDQGTTARGMAFFSGDMHIGGLNNVKMSTTNGFPVYINADNVNIVGENHFVNNANCPHALLTLAGAGHARITGIYFDNLRDFPGIGINWDGSGTGISGAASRCSIIGNWFNSSNSLIFDNGVSLIELDCSQGSAYGTIIANNVSEGADGGNRIRSILNYTQGTRNNPAASLAMYGNSVQHAVHFITKNGTRGTAGTNMDATSGIPTAFRNMNIIDNNVIGGGGAGDPVNLVFGPTG